MRSKCRNLCSNDKSEVTFATSEVYKMEGSGCGDVTERVNRWIYQT